MPQKQPSVLDVAEAPAPAALPAETTAMAPVRQSSGELELILRMAADPNVPVDKLERLLAMHERLDDRQAAQAFNVAMAAAQAEMRPVAADADNPQTRSRYASYEALDRSLRPIYTKHGFALSFNTGDAPGADVVRVLCDVTHIGGHSKPYKADMPADGKGAKGGDVMTKTHATGAAMSYGMRYLLKMIWNVAVGEDDNDGNGASRVTVKPQAPAGYDDWLIELSCAADEGFARLEQAFKESKAEFKAYMTANDKTTKDKIKAKARAVRS